MKKQESSSGLGRSQHNGSSANLDNVNQSSGDIFSIGEDINALEQYGITPEIYEKYKKMTDD